MPAIYLVRHGQASFGTDDYDVLSAIGREQAEVAGAELARRGPRAPLVVCGTLNRQRDTAEILIAAAGLTGAPRVDSRWNEYDHLGLVERYPGPIAADTTDSRSFQASLDRALQAWIAEADTDTADDADTGGSADAPTGPDGWRAFSTGATGALQDLIAALGTGTDAIVVTSGGVLAALCGALLGLPSAGVIALNRVVVNAAITTVVAGRSGTSLLTFNEHAHFAGDRRRLLTYR